MDTFNLLQKVDIPEGESGDWKVERFTVSDEDAKFNNLRAAIGASSRWIMPGEYTRLTHCGYVVMSDTPVELRDHFEVVDRAKGQVLIHGLGLGVVTEACLRKPEVDHVIVIEISEDVIKLVGTYLKERWGNRLTILRADSLTWKPPKGFRYDVVWYDIWPDLCADNLGDMKLLHRRYGRRCDWQGSWGRSIVESHNRRYGW